MAWIGCFHQVGCRADLKHQVGEVLQLEVMHTRRDVGAVAGVEADFLLGDAAQRVVERFDAQRDELPAILDCRVGGAVVVRRHARVVDLQEKAGLDDCEIFDPHRLAECFQILLVGAVVPVLVVQFEIGRRDCGDEGFFDLLSRH